tara:strand:- start:460 stop:702 length:243 start_codon:yes stop_codon:yes gene_type:complete
MKNQILEMTNWLIRFDQLLLNETSSKDFLDKENAEFLQKNIAHLKDISSESEQIIFDELSDEIKICKQIGSKLGLVLEDI